MTLHKVAKIKYQKCPHAMSVRKRRTATRLYTSEQAFNFFKYQKWRNFTYGMNPDGEKTESETASHVKVKSSVCQAQYKRLPCGPEAWPAWNAQPSLNYSIQKHWKTLHQSVRKHTEVNRVFIPDVEGVDYRKGGIQVRQRGNMEETEMEKDTLIN